MLVAARVDDVSDNAVVVLGFVPQVKGRLVGRVHDDAGAAVAGAYVQVCRSDTWRCQNLETDRRGRYASAPLHPGVVTIWVQPPPGARLLGTEDALAALVHPGAPTIYDVELRRGGVVAGTFEEWNGNPVAVSGGSLCRNDYCPSYVGPDETLGSFLSGVAPTGTYRLDLYDPESNLSQLDGVVVTEGATTTVRVQRPRRAALSGTVTYYDGAPARGVTVALCADTPGEECSSRFTFTDGSGRYRFTQVEPDTWRPCRPPAGPAFHPPP